MAREPTTRSRVWWDWDYERLPFDILHHVAHEWSGVYERALMRVTRSESEESRRETLLLLARALKGWFLLAYIGERGEWRGRFPSPFYEFYEIYDSLSRSLSRIERIENGYLMAKGLEALSDLIFKMFVTRDVEETIWDFRKALRDLEVNVEDTTFITQLSFLTQRIPTKEFAETLSPQAPPTKAVPIAEPPSRYADFTFFYGEGEQLAKRVPDGHVLQVEKWYQLEVAVSITPIGIPPEKPERLPIREPKQKENVTIMVTAEGDGFEIAEPVQTLILPPLGDSVENAMFRVRPLRHSTNSNDLSEIRVRLYYEFNLIEVVIIRAEVVGKFDSPLESHIGLQQPIVFRQERLERQYIDFDNVQPRTMQIDITKHREYFLFNFAFRNDREQQLVFTAPARLLATDLEDALVRIRNIWYDIAMSKTFTEQLHGDEDEFLKNIRKLAKAGRNLWNKLFKLESKSSMYKIGTWLEKHPQKQDGIIQITLSKDAASCVFPWALIYDQPVPIKSHELPKLEGFWGIRYSIEQQLPQIINRTDEPIHINDVLKIGFMLWDQFKNADQEKILMENLIKQSMGKLHVSTPPITDVDTCYNLLANCDAHILYFYSHGYTCYRQADIGVRPNFDLFLNHYKQLDETSPLREIYQILYQSIIQKDFERDRSWIELGYGKLYLDELPDFIEKRFDSCPLVILNMCESAQITPSLSDSFIHFFLDRGASGVIGTECPMTIEFAHPFAEKFFQDILTGEQIGMALLNARRYFLKLNNPLGLAYTLFGLATVSFKPPVIST